MKTLVYELVVDIWRLAARYQFKKLKDFEWEVFIKDGQCLFSKYREKGEAVECLYREIFAAFQAFYETLGQ